MNLLIPKKNKLFLILFLKDLKINIGGKNRDDRLYASLSNR
jgi:hypothetical protein